MPNTPLLNSDNTSEQQIQKVKIQADDLKRMHVAGAWSGVAAIILLICSVLTMLDMLTAPWVVGAFVIAALVKNNEALVAERLLAKYTTYATYKESKDTPNV